MAQDQELEYLMKFLRPQAEAYSPDVAMVDEAEDTADSLSGYAPTITTSPSTSQGQQMQKALLDQMNFVSQRRKGAESSYDRLLKERSEMKVPQIDPFDQILGAMAPLAVAALGGEAGALSAPRAFSGYQDFLKEDLSRKKDIYSKQREENQLKLQRAETRRSGLEKTQADLALKSNIDPLKADIEMSKAAASGAFVPFDKKATIEKIAGKKADVSFIRANMASIVEQLRDPKIPFSEKYAAAQRAGKLINSALGADALSNEEADRALNQLNVLPSFSKPEFGPSIEAFAQSLDNQKRSLDRSVQMMDQQMADELGRGYSSGQSGSSQGTKKAKPKWAK